MGLLKDLEHLIRGNRQAESTEADNQEVYYLYGDRLNLDGYDGRALLRDGKLVDETLLREGNLGSYTIFISNGTRFGGVSYPVERVFGRKGVEKFQRDYAREQHRMRMMFGPDGPPATWQPRPDQFSWR